MILVPVNVTDHDGNTLTGLRRENFTIFDEQRAQPIVSFTSEDSPASVGLVLDVSGSMRSTLNDFKQVVHEFLDGANPEDEFSLFTVSSAPARLSEFTTDSGTVENSVRLVRAGGDTALIDTIYLALTRMRAASRSRRALLVMSDGVDNHSRFSKGELMGVAVEADTQIYTIVIDNTPINKKPIELTEEHQGWNFMQSLSERTGGVNFRVKSVGGAKDAARRTGEAIRNQYVIGYRAPDMLASGKWHRIRVKADVPHSSVYARSGYYSR
jgi:Ca-activated chloride channel family protein